MIKINLAPATLLEKHKQAHHTMQAGAAGALVLVLVAGVSMLHLRRTQKLETLLVQLKAEHQALQPQVNEVSQLEGEIGALRAKLNAIIDLLKDRLAYPRFMEDLLRTLPSGVWFKSMSASLQQGGGGQVQFQFGAEALSGEDLADWMRTMEDSGQFKDLNLGGISIAGGPLRTLNFSMNGRYEPKAEARP